MPTGTTSCSAEATEEKHMNSLRRALHDTNEALIQEYVQRIEELQRLQSTTPTTGCSSGMLTVAAGDTVQSQPEEGQEVATPCSHVPSSSSSGVSEETLEVIESMLSSLAVSSKTTHEMYLSHLKEAERIAMATKEKCEALEAEAHKMAKSFADQKDSFLMQKSANSFVVDLLASYGLQAAQKDAAGSSGPSVLFDNALSHLGEVFHSVDLLVVQHLMSLGHTDIANVLLAEMGYLPPQPHSNLHSNNTACTGTPATITTADKKKDNQKKKQRLWEDTVAFVSVPPEGLDASVYGKLQELHEFLSDDDLSNGIMKCSDWTAEILGKLSGRITDTNADDDYTLTREKREDDANPFSSSSLKDLRILFKCLERDLLGAQFVVRLMALREENKRGPVLSQYVALLKDIRQAQEKLNWSPSLEDHYGALSHDASHCPLVPLPSLLGAIGFAAYPSKVPDGGADDTAAVAAKQQDNGTTPTGSIPPKYQRLLEPTNTNAKRSVSSDTEGVIAALRARVVRAYANFVSSPISQQLLQQHVEDRNRRTGRMTPVSIFPGSIVDAMGMVACNITENLNLLSRSNILEKSIAQLQQQRKVPTTTSGSTDEERSVTAEGPILTLELPPISEISGGTENWGDRQPKENEAVIRQRSAQSLQLLEDVQNVSLFYCPVSGQLTTDPSLPAMSASYNPPCLLTCGHPISHKSLISIVEYRRPSRLASPRADDRLATLRCPYCSKTTRLPDVITLHL